MFPSCPVSDILRNTCIFSAHCTCTCKCTRIYPSFDHALPPISHILGAKQRAPELVKATRVVIEELSHVPLLCIFVVCFQLLPLRNRTQRLGHSCCSSTLKKISLTASERCSLALELCTCRETGSQRARPGKWALP